MGKYLSKIKNSSSSHVSLVSRPKSCILILFLLFLCGDTGASINPGPISPTEPYIDVAYDSKGYLREIDPDLHYFNDTELSSINFKSYTVNEFKESDLNKPELLNIMHHNCRSILANDKLDNYDYFLEMLGDPFDVIGFTETWLDNNNASIALFNEYKYKHVYQTRPLDINSDCKTKGGGISLFIREIILFKERKDLSVLLPHLELLFVEIYILCNLTYFSLLFLSPHVWQQ